MVSPFVRIPMYSAICYTIVFIIFHAYFYSRIRTVLHVLLLLLILSILYSVYALELFDPFIFALVACCHQQSIVFLGMTREFSKPVFFKKLSVYFTYTLVPYNNTVCSSNNSSDDYSNIGLFICQLLPQAMRS